MKIQDFLEHHGIGRNPFAEEDAKSDKVFKDHCNSYTNQAPEFQIDSTTFETTFALFLREQDAFDHGLSSG
jgi:hypothetical protein